jgi:hypothetical protein
MAEWAKAQGMCVIAAVTLHSTVFTQPQSRPNTGIEAFIGRNDKAAGLDLFGDSALRSRRHRMGFHAAGSRKTCLYIVTPSHWASTS